MPTANSVTIVIVDDHPVVRDGLNAMLSMEPDLQVVGEAATGGDALSLLKTLRPSVVLMDLLLPDMGGAEVIRRVSSSCSDINFIVLTTLSGDEEIYRALEAGARGYPLRTWPGKSSSRPSERSTAASATFRPRWDQRSPKVFPGRT